MTGGGASISVVVLVYNSEPTIERCLASIFEQDFEDFEVLLVTEQRSADRSVEICRQWAGADYRVRVLPEDGTGCIAARNRGLAEARGRYVTFVDADDYIVPGMFRTMYERAVEQKLDICFCGSKRDRGEARAGEMGDYMQYADELLIATPQTQKQIVYKLALTGRSATVWAKLFKRSFLCHYGLRFDPNAYAEDYVFSLMCIPRAKRLGTVEASYYIYADRPGSRIYSSSPSDIKKSAEILWAAVQRYEGAGAGEVKAHAAARIVSSMLFNLKLKPLPLEVICETVSGVIHGLGLPPHLAHAADENCFKEYVKTMGMGEQSAKNYRQFILSLQSRDTLLDWQKRYAKMEAGAEL